MADAGEIGGGAATGALSGAATGATVGAAATGPLAPVGALVGGLVGALFGGAGAAGKKPAMSMPTAAPAAQQGPTEEEFYAQEARVRARKGILDELASEKASEQLHAQNILEEMT